MLPRYRVLLAVVLIAAMGRERAEAGVKEQGPQYLKDMSSIGDSLRHARKHPIHILYVHGMDALGSGDSWEFQKGICKFLPGCQISRNPVRVEREYVDQGIFAKGAPPPAFEYMGAKVWPSVEDWLASTPFVDHYVLSRRDGGNVVVDEINWWPLVFPLKCRDIITGEAQSAGPDAALLTLCSQKTETDSSGHYTSYQWLAEDAAARFKAMPHRGALLNRILKNNIMDWGVSDAFLAVGSLAPVFREAMRQLFVKSAAFHADNTKSSQWLEDFRQPPADDREYIVVSHSLGSYLVFSTLNFGGFDMAAAANAAAAGSAAAASTEDAAAQYILERTSLVYFFANQVALLELAIEQTPSSPANLQALDAQKVQPAPTLSKRMQAWGELRKNYRRKAEIAQASAPATVPPQVVAWTDPSDLLSWRLPAIDGVKVDNVLVHNSWLHYFLANPTTAHIGYSSNKEVLRVMMRTTQP